MAGDAGAYPRKRRRPVRGGGFALPPRPRAGRMELGRSGGAAEGLIGRRALDESDREIAASAALDARPEPIRDFLPERGSASRARRERAVGRSPEQLAVGDSIAETDVHLGEPARENVNASGDAAAESKQERLRLTTSFWSPFGLGPRIVSCCGMGSRG